MKTTFTQLFFLSFFLLISTQTFAQECLNNSNNSRVSFYDACAAFVKLNKKEIPDKGKAQYDSLMKLGNELVRLADLCKKSDNENVILFNKISALLSMSEIAFVMGERAKEKEILDRLEYIYKSPNDIPVNIPYSYEGKKYIITFSSDDQVKKWARFQSKFGAYYYSLGKYTVAEKYFQEAAKYPIYKFESDKLLMFVDVQIKNGRERKAFFPYLVTATKLVADDEIEGGKEDSVRYRNKKYLINNILAYQHGNWNEARRKENNIIDPSGEGRASIARSLYYLGEYTSAGYYAREAADTSKNIEFAEFILNKIYEGETYSNKAQNKSAAAAIYHRYGMSSFDVGQINMAIKKVSEIGATNYAEHLNAHLKRVEESIAQAARKERRLEARRKISLTPAIEIAGLPFGHVPIFLKLRTGNISQEFFFDYLYNAKSKYRFGGYRNSPLAKVSTPFRFKGYSVGYGLNYLFVGSKQFKKGRPKYYSGFVGFDFRYSRWNMEELTVARYSDADKTSFIANSNIAPRQSRYEGTIKVGFVYHSRWFEFDYYIGTGLGYRDLSATNATFKSEYWDHSHYTQARFSKLYAPLRAGVRLGFNIL